MRVGTRSRRARKRANRLDNAALAANDLAGIFLVHMNFHEDGAVVGFGRNDVQIVLVLDKGTNQATDKPGHFLRLISHEATPLR